MLPALSSYDSPSFVRTHSILFTESHCRNGSCFICGPHIANGRISKFRARLSTSYARTAFHVAVMHVVGIRSTEEVSWSNARRVVAMMQYLFTFWNRAVMQFPRYA